MLCLLMICLTDTAVQIFLRVLEPILLLMVIGFAFKSTLAAVGLPLPRVQWSGSGIRFFIKIFFKAIFKAIRKFCRLIPKCYKKVQNFLIARGVNKKNAKIISFVITAVIVMIII